MFQGELLFLGTGGSMGVPIVGCSCKVCLSSDPKNKRLRVSALLKIEGKQFLIDAGPDFRAQALTYGVSHLDGFLLTHPHFDHIGGLDDLRSFQFFQKTPLPCLLSQESLDSVKTSHSYFFEGEQKNPFCFQVLPQEEGVVDFEGIRWQYINFRQKKDKVTGYRLGNMAYVLDIRSFSETIFQRLQGVEVLILSALRYEPSPSHFSIGEAVEFAKKVGAKQTWLSHMAHEVDYEEGSRILPSHTQLAYDGLKVNFYAD